MRRHISYANVTATIALVFAMSGSALAAKHYLLSSTKQISPKVLHSLASRNKSLFNKLAKTATVAAASTATSATSATTAATATSATTATTADNAKEFGGLPASDYTQSGCNSLTGQIKGFALIPASGTFPSTFTTLTNAYSCSAQPVQAKRTGEGEYVVQFEGSPVTIAAGDVLDEKGFTDNAFVSFSALGAGEFKVNVFNAVLSKQEDRPFTVIVP